MEPIPIGGKSEKDSNGVVKFVKKNIDRIAATVTIADALMDPFNNVAGDMIEQKNNSVDTFDGFELVYQTEIKSYKTIIENMGCVIKTAGSDEDAALKSPEDTKEEMEEKIKISTLVKNNNIY